MADIRFHRQKLSVDRHDYSGVTLGAMSHLNSSRSRLLSLYPILRLIITFLTPVIMLAPLHTALSQDKGETNRVGIVEFRIENDIGLENAGLIIPEWLASEFVRIGRYEVSERLSLELLLEEQALGQAGFIEEETAAKVGKLYGVEGIVTGSVMRLGSTISVTGRIIASKRGKF